MITKKNTAAATLRNVIAALMKSPYLKWLELIVNERFSRFGLPKISAMIGVIRSATNALTSAANTRAITSATAVHSLKLVQGESAITLCKR